MNKMADMEPSKTTDGPTLRVHSILYGNEPEGITRALENLNRAADIAIAQGVFSKVSVHYGDCSPTKKLDAVFIDSTELQAIEELTYKFFDANHGSARGHNELLKDGDADFVLIMNPDIVVAPNCLVELHAPFKERDDVGMIEAKQLPIEHPKQYDVKTGETAWAATACTLIPYDVIRKLNGFDYETFFLYCDDVDFSWRVLLEGKKVIYRPSAAVFHDKRLGSAGNWVPGEAEKFYSAEAALLLAYKYSRNDLVERILTDFRNANGAHFGKAVESFEKRQAEGRLPARIDRNHKVGKFLNGYYAKHRYEL